MSVPEQEFRMNPGVPLDGDFRASVLLAISLICGKCLVTQWMPSVSACHASGRACAGREPRASEPVPIKTIDISIPPRLLKSSISVDLVLPFSPFAPDTNAESRSSISSSDTFNFADAYQREARPRAKLPSVRSQDACPIKIIDRNLQWCS